MLRVSIGQYFRTIHDVADGLKGKTGSVGTLKLVQFFKSMSYVVFDHYEIEMQVP